MKNENLDILISRSLDMELSFETIYYLIVGDNATKNSKCVLVLTDFMNQKRISSVNFVRLIKLCPAEFA